MITDSIYRIGHNHEVCQDYALHHSDDYQNFQKDVHLALLSDGCSSSPDVDIGARALVHQARLLLTQQRTLNADYVRKTFPGNVISCARVVARGMGVEDRALDATLLGVHMDELEAHLFVFGDGFSFYMEKDDPGVLHLDHWDYSENTPYYLSVEHDYYSKQAFTNFPQVLTRTSYVFRPTGVTKNVHTYTSLERYVSAISSPEDLLFIGVASDGWASFYQKDSQAPVSIETVFAEFIDFPVATSNLLKRQVTWMLKKFDKLGFKHYDDLSMAIIYNNEV